MPSPVPPRGAPPAALPSAPLRSAPNLSARPWVAHGFTTRVGGVSGGALSTLNLALRGGETADALT
ncbi:MAG: hypothetical protein ABMB14_25290, partial [Myxococcota bacterium]